MSKYILSTFFILGIIGFVLFQSELVAQEKDPEKEIGFLSQSDAFRINFLGQAGLRYSLKNDQFQGGRTFEAMNARLSFRGKLESGFYYRLFFDMAPEPRLLDAFVGYHFDDKFRLAVGAMKPLQTLDYIPNPGRMYFVDRAQITGLLVQSREIGISAVGESGSWKYFVGVFNGNKLSLNNNNKFYGIGRLQYSLDVSEDRKIQLAVSSSHGNSEGTISGSFGPELRGKRQIYGTDLKIEWGRWLLAGEYLMGELETIDITDRKERISGYYLVGGYEILENTLLLSRWQSWAYREADFRDHQFTFGLNHHFNSTVMLRFNFDAFFPEEGSEQYGTSTVLQIQF